MKLTELEDHDKDPAIEPRTRKPFPKQVQEGEVASIEMTITCARDLTDRIKAGVNNVAELLHRVHEGRAWLALGYDSWKQYCETEFQMSKRHSYRLLDFVEIRNELAKSDPGVTPEHERTRLVL
jgi:hypothetical protein